MSQPIPFICYNGNVIKDAPAITLSKLISSFQGKPVEEYIAAFYEWLDGYLKPTGINIYGDLASQQVLAILYFLLGTNFIKKDIILSFNERIMEKGIHLCRFLVRADKETGMLGIRIEFLNPASSKKTR